jgi:hypothetical protein
VEVHCNDELELGLVRVEATASLVVMMAGSDKQRSHVRLFEGSNSDLGRDSSAVPPIFSGTVTLVRKEEGVTTPSLLGNRRRGHIECTLYVMCRGIGDESPNTGLDLVSREFVEHRLLYSLNYRAANVL